MLSSGEIDGEGAFVFPGAEHRHGDVGEGRHHHEVGEAVEEHRHEEVAQPKHLLHCVCVSEREKYIWNEEEKLSALYFSTSLYIYSVYRWPFYNIC